MAGMAKKCSSFSRIQNTDVHIMAVDVSTTPTSPGTPKLLFTLGVRSPETAFSGRA
jgi:hypothetical protein